MLFSRSFSELKDHVETYHSIFTNAFNNLTLSNWYNSQLLYLIVYDDIFNRLFIINNDETIVMVDLYNDGRYRTTRHYMSSPEMSKLNHLIQAVDQILG